MARGITVATTLLLVALAVVAPPFAHAASEYLADAPVAAKESPAGDGKAGAPAAAEESSDGKADALAVAAETPGAKADAPEAAAESPPADAVAESSTEDGKADAPTAAGESAYAVADAPAEATDSSASKSGDLPYVQFVIKNPVKSKEDPDARADGLPIDPTPDAQAAFSLGKKILGGAKKFLRGRSSGRVRSRRGRRG
uniref:Uncharacterized protein n=1 Tax=Oryza brachyantha TaxID=4533 RepID=J3MU21_ORYBR